MTLPLDNAPPPLADPIDDKPADEAMVALLWRAFDLAGGADALADWANSNRTQFYLGVARLLAAHRRGARAAAPETELWDVSAEPIDPEEWVQTAQGWVSKT